MAAAEDRGERDPDDPGLQPAATPKLAVVQPEADQDREHA